jgi:hypothetical protein
MKKLNLLFILITGLIILSSCSNDDEGSEQNLIIGTWKPIKEVSVCSTGSEQVYDFDSCEQQSRYVFASHDNPDLETDGTITITEKSLINGDCQTTYTVTGTWSLDTDDLTLTIDGETENPTFFELTSNRLRIGYYDNDPNDPCDGGNLLSHYYTEFQRN